MEVTMKDLPSPVTREFPTQKASNAEMFPLDDVIVDRKYTMRIGGFIQTYTYNLYKPFNILYRSM